MPKRIFILVIWICLISLFISQQTTPVWPKVFSQAFQFVRNDFHTTGKYWYDYDALSERMDFADGSLTSCGQLSDQNTPCSMITLNKKLYIILPQKKLCCFQDDFGIRSPHWLQENGYSYIGEKSIDQKNYYVWTSSGIFRLKQDDPDSGMDWYFADESPKRIPKREQFFDKFYFDYWTNTYSQNPIDSKVFAIPSYCTTDCDDDELKNQKNNLFEYFKKSYKKQMKQIAQ